MDGDLRAEFRADKVLEAVCVCETERDWGEMEMEDVEKRETQRTLYEPNLHMSY